MVKSLADHCDPFETLFRDGLVLGYIFSGIATECPGSSVTSLTMSGWKLPVSKSRVSADHFQAFRLTVVILFPVSPADMQLSAQRLQGTHMDF